MMSNLPPTGDYQDRVLGALNKLLGQKEELSGTIAKLFHQQELYEARTNSEFERFGETLKGVNSRLTKLEDDAALNVQSRFQSIRVKSDKFRENLLRGAGAILLAGLGAAVSWFLRGK